MSQPVSSRRTQRRAAAASVIGTTVEWYDYFIFGTAAALVFDQLFFPGLSPTLGTLSAFAGFGVGFLARPVGSVLFAHIGDRIGRKPAMIASLILMGVATVMIGLLPSYGTIGIWAPVALVVLRLVQGIGVGGEWGGAALIATEHSSASRRGLFGTAPMIGVPLGTMLSSGVFSIVSSVFDDEQFLAFGWRIPFLLSGVLILIGFVIRSTVTESPVFLAQRKSGVKAERAPVLEVLRRHPKTLALATGMLVTAHATFYVSGTWMVSYATSQVGFDRVTVLNTIAVVAAVGVVMKVASGWFSDRWGRRPLIISGAVFLAVIAFPYFWLINSGVVALLAVAVFLAEAGRSLISGPVAAVYSELFDTRVRYTGASLAYQIGSILGGGFAPAICTALVALTGSYWAIGVYLILLNAIALFCALKTRETRGDSLVGADANTAVPAERA